MNSSPEEVLFALALAKPVEKRTAFLDVMCEGDSALRQRLEALLAAHEQPETILATQAKEAQPTIKLDLPDLPDEAVGQTLGRYKLLERVGEGGCGVVYVAEQTEPVRRRVALKVIKLGMDTKQVVARFEAERQALAMMDHPNIAKVLDAGTTDVGRPYFVMELVRGIRITDFCDQANTSTKERLDLFIKVCQAIQHAHQKGIIHRDIKPSNILVTLHDGVAVPKVIDFGIAKATEGRLTDNTVYTQLHQFIGTPAYMSPEQAEMSGLDIDTRSDIYSLGVLLYELLTGKTPFDAKELMAQGIDAMRKTIREREPARPSTKLATLQGEELTTTAKRRSVEASKLANLLRGDLDWIVMKCLEKDRTRRYETANGLAADLKRHLSNEPVVARPPSTAYRFQKAFRRNKLTFTAASCVLVSLVIALAFIWNAAQREGKARVLESIQRNRAEQERERAEQSQASEARLRREAEVSALAERRRAYASDMNLAQQSITLNNFGRAQELLDRHRPSTKNEIDLRGWEWRYLWQFCQGDDLFTLCRLTNSAFSLAASRDGRWLAVGEFAGSGVSVWDLRTRQEIARPYSGGVASSSARVAFSPREPLLAFSTATQEGSTVRLWNAATRIPVATLPLDNTCIALTFSEDGRRLATFATRPSATITLWSIPDGQKLGTFPMDDLLNVTGQSRYSTSPDMRLAAYAMRDGRIRIIDLSTGRERWTAQATKEFTIALTFSPDGRILASSEGYAGGTIKLWEVATGREISRLEGHQGWVTSLLFWPDGRKLASASADQTIRLWDVSDPAHGRPVSFLRGHNVEVWSLALLPDQVTLVSGGKDGSVRLWDTAKPQRNQAALTLATNLLSWHFAPDGKAVTGLDREGHVIRWKGDMFQEAQQVGEVKRSDPFIGDFVLLARDGLRVATGSTNGIVRVWDLDRGGPPRELSTHPMNVRPMAFLPRSDGILIQHENNLVSERNLSTGRETQVWQAPDRVRAWAVSGDERWLTAFSYSGASILQDRSARSQTNLGVNLQQASAANFSADGRQFAVVSWIGGGKVWSLDPLRELGTLRGFLQGSDSVVFSPNGDRLAAGGAGKEALKLYDSVSYQELLTLEAEGSNYQSTEFSPDGNIIGSRNGQNTLRQWRAPSWEEIATAEAKENAEVKQP